MFFLVIHIMRHILIWLNPGLIDRRRLRRDLGLSLPTFSGTNFISLEIRKEPLSDANLSGSEGNDLSRFADFNSNVQLS